MAKGKPRELVSLCVVTVDGVTLSRLVMDRLLDMVVDQHSHLPDMFTIRLRDPEMELVDKGPFDLTKKVRIDAATRDGDMVTLMEGEITALEPSFGEGMVAELVVAGYDVSHRLYREKKSRAHTNKKDSDLASEIARSAGLKAQVEPTPTVYEHIFQHNQSDLAFLMQRAWRIGYECFVREGMLSFRPPLANGEGIGLMWGDDLLTFRPRMTLAEQVDEVVVKGWDAETQTAVVGRAQKGHLFPEIGEGKDGPAWAGAFGAGRQVIVDVPVVSQAEADLLAAARLDEISGAFVEAEGRAFRRPDIQVGRTVKLDNLGERFSGTYLVTSARHLYSADGLTTTFNVRGLRTGLLAEQWAHSLSPARWPGVVTAVVTNTDDPKDWGRVKLKFPWMTEDAESDWARVLGAGAGPEAGLYVMPEVGDEVLVAFAHGDFGQPFVLGGLWNGKCALPPEAAAAAAGEKPLVRTWHSRTGHRLAMYDDAEDRIELVTAGGHQLILDDANGTITLTSKDGQAVTLEDGGRKITLKSGGKLEIASNGDLAIHTDANLSLKAAQLTLEGTAQATLKAPTVSIDGSALTEVKGGLIKLN
jgi:phage protein D/phage baseplate assembly protein gpV